MEPRYVDQDEFAVAGVVARAAPGRHDYQALWARFDAGGQAVRAAATRPVYYGVHLPCEDPERVDYLAGMAVPAGTAVAGMETRAVPAGRYAVFTGTIATIGQIYAHVYGGWTAPAGWAIDPTRPDLEVYGGAGPEGAVEIYIPLKAVSH
ncbi:MAG: hypothetical protein GX657_13805 [Chloroflexi bacterium]|nr:hypothetical protein [Chloroflexota bacterium]